MTLRIKKALANCNSIEELYRISEKANTKVAWWGKRYIYVEGYKGKLHIEALNIRVVELVKKNFEFTEPEREMGKKIAAKITYLYKANDELVKKSNCLTKLLCKILNFFSSLKDCGYGPRFHWGEYYEDGDCIIFDYYTQKQFQNVFNRLPLANEEPERRYGYPVRWTAPTQAVQ